MDLAFPEGDSRLGFSARGMQYSAEGQAEQASDYTAWQSPFAASEIYGASLHVPYDALWKKLVPGLNCQEVLIVQETWGIPKQGDYSPNFSARVYCRSGLEINTSIGHMGFCVSGKSCWR